MNYAGDEAYDDDVTSGINGDVVEDLDTSDEDLDEADTEDPEA